MTDIKLMAVTAMIKHKKVKKKNPSSMCSHPCKVNTQENTFSKNQPIIKHERQPNSNS